MQREDGVLDCCSRVGLTQAPGNEYPGITNCCCAFFCAPCHFGDISEMYQENKFPCSGQNAAAASLYFILSPCLCFSQWLFACPVTYQARRAMIEKSRQQEKESRCTSATLSFFCSQCSNAEVYRKTLASGGQATEGEYLPAMVSAPRRMRMNSSSSETSCKYCRMGAPKTSSFGCHCKMGANTRPVQVNV